MLSAPENCSAQLGILGESCYLDIRHLLDAAVDEKGVLVTGGAAVATGGLSVLARAAWDRLSRAGDACKNASDQGRKALAQRYPGLLESREIPADMGDAKDTAEIP